jgi:hypothetical protein
VEQADEKEPFHAVGSGDFCSVGFVGEFFIILNRKVYFSFHNILELFLKVVSRKRSNSAYWMILKLCIHFRILLAINYGFQKLR